MRGYAVPPGEPGSRISRVELSPNGGRSWIAARLEGKAEEFSWQLWEAEVTVPAGASTLVVRATDSRGRTHPEKASWNFKGYLNDSWHRVPISAG